MRNFKSLTYLLIIILFAVCLLLEITRLFLKLKLDDDFFSALGSVADSLASLTGIGVLLFTYFALQEARKQREIADEPVVTIRLLPDIKNNNFLSFTLKNTGGGPAYDLSVKFNPDLPYGEGTLNNLNMFKQMSLLDKNEEVNFLFDSAFEYYNSNHPMTTMATVIYYKHPKDQKKGKAILRDFEINFEERKGQMNLITRDISDLVKEVQELKHAIVIANYERGDKND
ncbi:hypothetical protein [Priestia megaterium]|uniref:hypothetical protein n=1 Tax=Priestia megaterium TaxID=1404 RepID=UPI000EF9DA33|nr:hypothetical protein [Priestia megaterium]RMA90898.1 hypothetical protein DEU44_2985 [Priestia megaterium]